MKLVVKKEDIGECNGIIGYDFPKYSSQIINLANQNAGGTRPKVVGQLSELFQEFQGSGQRITIDNWRQWYLSKYPKTIEEAVAKIMGQMVNLQNVLPLIDKFLVRQWVEDLVFNKTFNGLYFQKAILETLAKVKGVACRLATPEEEAKGIDGFVGQVPYSVKPITYKGTMNRLSEIIDVKMIYYVKKDNGNLEVEIED